MLWRASSPPRAAGAAGGAQAACVRWESAEECPMFSRCVWSLCDCGGRERINCNRFEWLANVELALQLHGARMTLQSDATQCN